VALALYRTYRPGRFADVVGQEHVTAALVRAIEKNRVHHAYLFSGPRGCGKTSSARILARSLNCEKGPTAEPCGRCASCLDLAPNGPGSLDVVELDAATHGLVEDARELRERAHFAPVSSRFKIYIIDEAHQLGPGAANALLKIIEEPPEHVRFVFATTSPDKIIATIRSRTYHYPFRLVPTRLLSRHLAWVCEQEQVPADPAALDLVARAGEGSVRDALSVLGQLIAGAGDDGVTYALAHEQLGFTDAALLDSVIDALASDDAAGVFHAVDRVVESGHDPRRFLTDLLERLRDLLLVQTVPDALDNGLVTAPDDQGVRMLAQAKELSRADLVRLAQAADDGILAMRGTTPTRLQLELVCARLLLPGAGGGLVDVQSRLDRLERQLARGQGVRPVQVEASPPEKSPPAKSPSAPQPRQATVPAPSEGIAAVRRAWPEVLERLRELRKTPWTFIKDNTEPLDVSDDTLLLGVRSSRLRDTLAAREDYAAYLQQAIGDVLGRPLRVEAVVKPLGTRGSPTPSPGAADTAGRMRARAAADPRDEQPDDEPGTPGRPVPGEVAVDAGRDAGPDAGSAGGPDPGPAAARSDAGPDSSPEAVPDDPAPDDPVIDDISGADLLSRELGASIIEVVDDP
jgi:DNA polymerase-3 subunit gamma/tau